MQLLRKPIPDSQPYNQESLMLHYYSMWERDDLVTVDCRAEGLAATIARNKDGRVQYQ